MASVKISALPAASSYLSGEELVPIVQLGVTRRTTAAAIANAAIEYDVDHPYQTGFTVRANDGHFYIAQSDNTGQDPTDRNPTYWLPSLITSDLSLTVGTDFTWIPC